MTLHHKGHHATYVSSLNNFTSQYASAPDLATANALLPALNFHSGGHINHSLFWENLAPKASGGGSPPSGRLATAIDDTFGSYTKFKASFNKALAGIQGSGWAWLVQDKETGQLSVRTYANQDPVVGAFRPLLGVDAWEHAYYLDYQNRKAEYFERVWEVVNWAKAAERMA
jgi:Fe-Mn family superoxide dismutase